MTKKENDLKEFLDEKYEEFCRPEFIESDPISIPHQYSSKQDIEIAGFLAATIAWGQRPTIIKNAERIMELMDGSPYDFIKNHVKKDLDRFEGSVHRTFNSEDLKFFCSSLKKLYDQHGSLEDHFIKGINDNSPDMASAITHFRAEFFSIEHQRRTEKHLANPSTGSAAKRINMYLRWMVRPADRGVDFGIWKQIPTSILSCPLDVHSGRIGRKLGILKRKQNDWKAVAELDSSLRRLDPEDPVKYDYALFGLGVFEGF